jgi:hypothetical protein
MLLQIVWMIATSAAILALSAAAFYSLCYLTLSVVRLFPMIGRRHRHRRWTELNGRPVSPDRKSFTASIRTGVPIPPAARRSR